MGGGLRPGTGAPKTPFNGPLTPDRVVVLADCSLAEVKQIKRAFHTTVNDVVLAAVTSSLRAVFRAQGLLDEIGERPLIASVPISVRPPDSEREFGNKTSILMVPLPTHVDDPIERLELIHGLADETKAHHKSMSSDLLEQWAGLIPPWVTSMGSRTIGAVGGMGLLPPMSNVTISNVQGSPIPLYLAGAEVVGMYPLGPLLEGSGLNITVISHCDNLHIGLMGDPTLVRDPRAITAGIVQGVAELLELATRSEQQLEEPA
jgi:diacylglycerol O-acyltransferase